MPQSIISMQKPSIFFPTSFQRRPDSSRVQPPTHSEWGRRPVRNFRIRGDSNDTAPFQQQVLSGDMFIRVNVSMYVVLNVFSDYFETSRKKYGCFDASSIQTCVHICERTSAYIRVYIHVKKCTLIWLYVYVYVYVHAIHTVFLIIQHKWNPEQEACTLRHNARISHDAGWGVEDNGLCGHQELANRDYK